MIDPIKFVDALISTGENQMKSLVVDSPDIKKEIIDEGRVVRARAIASLEKLLKRLDQEQLINRIDTLEETLAHTKRQLRSIFSLCDIETIHQQLSVLVHWLNERDRDHDPDSSDSIAAATISDPSTAVERSTRPTRCTAFPDYSSANVGARAPKELEPVATDAEGDCDHGGRVSHPETGTEVQKESDG